ITAAINLYDVLEDDSQNIQDDYNSIGVDEDGNTALGEQLDALDEDWSVNLGDKIGSWISGFISPPVEAGVSGVLKFLGDPADLVNAWNSLVSTAQSDWNAWQNPEATNGLD